MIDPSRQVRSRQHSKRHDTDMLPIRALPDELLLGFRARLAIVYGASSSRTFDRKLVETCWRMTKEEVLPVTALIRLGAAAADCSEWSFLVRHSNVAVNAPVNNPLRVLELSSQLSSPRVAQIMAPGPSQLRLCPHCVQEDNSRLGFTYWRRSHQIPGRYVCEAHEVPLRLAFPDLPLTSLPYDWIDSSEAVDDFLVQNHHHNPYVRWYLNHVDQIAAGRTLINARLQRAEIQAVVQSWRRSGAGWMTQLACLISDAFTVEWLGATISRACSTVEGIATNIVSPMIYDYMPASQREMAVAAGLAFARTA